MIANARFAIKGRDEKPYSDYQGLPNLTRAAVTKTFTGDIAGEGHVGSRTRDRASANPELSVGLP